MNFVSPMAGRGQRFVDAGYDLPKMLIPAHGKTLMEWSIDSLPLELCTNLVCIILREHEEEYRLSDKIMALYDDRFSIKFLFLDQVTRGQAETVFLAHHLFDDHKELLIYNIDTYFYSPILAADLLRADHDGVLGAFHATENRFSFAKVGIDGYVTETAEKQVISNLALTGMYHFKEVQDFIETVSYHLNNDLRVNNEFYIAPMYNYLIKKGMRFIVNSCDSHFILGTPAELDYFLRNYKVKN